MDPEPDLELESRPVPCGPDWPCEMASCCICVVHSSHRDDYHACPNQQSCQIRHQRWRGIAIVTNGNGLTGHYHGSPVNAAWSGDDDAQLL